MSYIQNISEPIFNKNIKFPNSEKTTTDKNFLLALKYTTSEITKETARRNSVILRSALALPKKNILIFLPQPSRKFSKNLRGNCFLFTFFEL